MSLTTDPNDPRLGRGIDKFPVGQNEVYLVLSEEERAKGFVRPVRRRYQHVGIRPQYPTRPLTDEEKERYDQYGYVKFEEYPPSASPATGRFWTEAQLNGGCGAITTMGLALCETYARDPKFYGATYCCGCNKHLAVAEFRWIEADGSTGPPVGS
jgi:hypothetical protein